MGFRRSILALSWVALCVLTACPAPSSQVPTTPSPSKDGKEGSEPPVLASPRSSSNSKEIAFGEEASFTLDKKALRASGGATLVSKLESSPYHYFRFVSREFEARTCFAFRDVKHQLPVVAVHGDAHLEQFVVTSDTYGLEDFDRSGYGPAVVDLVRFASSIDVACKQAKFACDSTAAMEKYLASYRDAIDMPRERLPPPSVAARVQRKAPQDRKAWLAWVDTQMKPLSKEEDARTPKSFAAFVDLQRAVHPDRPAEFYEIVRLGELKMGVGSSLERKLLFRIRGPSTDPSDDVVLEARSGDITESSGCVWRPTHNTALHVLLFMSLIGPRMPDVIGFVSLDRAPDNRPFWVQSWNPGYVELSATDIQSQAELEELAASAGQQLAGHFWTKFPEQLRAFQRFAQLQAFDLVRPRVLTVARELSKEIVAAQVAFTSAQ